MPGFAIVEDVLSTANRAEGDEAGAEIAGEAENSKLRTANVRDVLGDAGPRFGALVVTSVAGIDEHRVSLASQVLERVALRLTVTVSCRSDGGMHRARLGIHADVILAAEAPLVALARLIHLWVAFAILILGHLGAAMMAVSMTVPFLRNSLCRAKLESLMLTTSSRIRVCPTGVATA